MKGVWFDRLTMNGAALGLSMALGPFLRQAQGRLPADAGMTGDDGDVSTLAGRCVNSLAKCVQFSAECVHFGGAGTALTWALREAPHPA